MARQPRVTVNIRPLRKFAHAIERGGPDVRDAQRQWAARYMGAMRRRFVKLSRGGSDHLGKRWEPLAASTVRRRRKGGRRRGGVNQVRVSPRRTGGNVAILRDTSTLFTALDLGAPDAAFSHIKKGVRVGLSGQIGRIASYHQAGGRRGNWRLPQRKIFTVPDRQTVKNMAQDMARALQREAARASRDLRRN